MSKNWILTIIATCILIILQYTSLITACSSKNEAGYFVLELPFLQEDDQLEKFCEAVKEKIGGGNFVIAVRDFENPQNNSQIDSLEAKLVAMLERDTNYTIKIIRVTDTKKMSKKDFVERFHAVVIETTIENQINLNAYILKDTKYLFEKPYTVSLKSKSDEQEEEPLSNLHKELQLGHKTYEAEKIEEALEHFEKALKLGGTDNLLFYRLGFCNLYLGDFKKAAQFFDNVKKNELPEAYFYSGLAYYKLSIWDKSTKNLQMFLRFGKDRELTEQAKELLLKLSGTPSSENFTSQSDLNMTLYVNSPKYGYANLRNNPISGDIISKINHGTLLQQLDQIILNGGRWYKVRTALDERGWIFGDFISSGISNAKQGFNYEFTLNSYAHVKVPIANIRNIPSLKNSEIIDHIDGGTIIFISRLDRSGDWLEIRYENKNKSGWIHKSLLGKGAIASTRDFNINKYNDYILILHIWAVWCRPCKKELPNFNSFYESLKYSMVQLDKKRIKVVTLNADTDDNRVLQYMQDNGFDFPVYRDTGRRVIEMLFGRGVVYPSTFVFNNGKEVAAIPGENEWQSIDFIQLLRSQL